MLQILRRVCEVNYPQLMFIYEESNLGYGKKYSRSSNPWEQLRFGEDFLRDDIAAFLKEEGSILALWHAEGRPVSAMRLQPYADGFLLTCLETAREARGKGAAKSLILHTICDFEAERIYSHIRKDNVVSLSLHRSIGFGIIKDYAVLLDGTVSHLFYTLCYDRK